MTFGLAPASTSAMADSTCQPSSGCNRSSQPKPSRSSVGAPKISEQRSLAKSTRIPNSDDKMPVETVVASCSNFSS
jgi:hypothetical protein